MVAITAPAPSIARPSRTARPAPRLELVPPAGRAGIPWARLVAVVLAVVVVAVAALYLVRAEPVPPAGTIAVSDTTHTVAPGESMWTIAHQVAPAGEAATYVERLVEINGSATVAPGQVLVLPTP